MYYILKVLFIQVIIKNIEIGETVLKVLSKVIELNVEAFSINVATGILKTYQELLPLNQDYAKVLEQAVEPCLERVTLACNIDGEKLTISENDTFLSVSQAVSTGITLMKYGLLTNNNDLYMNEFKLPMKEEK